MSSHPGFAPQKYANTALSVKDYGAVGDGTTDDSYAIQLAIKSLDPFKGGSVYLPYGKYYIEKTIRLDRPVVLIGDGGAPQAIPSGPATSILVRKGTTGIKVAKYFGQDPPPVPRDYPGGDWAVIRDIALVAQDRDQTTTTASAFTPTSNPPAFAAKSVDSFLCGQVIGIQGAGPFQFIGATATVDKDTTQFTVTGPAPIRGADQNEPGDTVNVYQDDVVQGKRVITYAFPPNTTVLTVGYSNGVSTITTSQKATNSVTGGKVIVYDDMYGEIQSIDKDSRRIEIDNTSQGTPVERAMVYHADAGVYAKARFRMSNFSVTSFQGNGVHIRGDHGDLPSGFGSNANSWLLDYGVIYNNNRNGIHVSGTDSNAGTALCIDFTGTQANRLWGVNDGSFLGNTYLGCHVAGGLGYKVQQKNFTNQGIQPSDPGQYALEQGSNSRTTFIGCYTELSSTVNMFSGSTMVLGGTMSGNDGGFDLTTQNAIGVANCFQVGILNTVGGYSNYQITFLPYGPNSDSTASLLTLYASTKIWPKAGKQELRKTTQAEGAVGWWGFACGGEAAGLPFVWSDKDVKFGMGQFWVPRGLHLGTSPDGNLDESQSRYLTTGHLAPTSGYWYVGDISLENTPMPGGNIGYVCVRGGTAGATTWQNRQPYSVGAVVVPTTDNGYCYQCTVGGRPGNGEPGMWPTVKGQSVTDGQVTWICLGAAALFKSWGTISS